MIHPVRNRQPPEAITTSRVARHSDRLPHVGRVLAVVAHPDDESFGLGAVLSAFVESGARVTLVCFTHGEASTLGTTDVDLAIVRERELRNAASVLGIDSVALCTYSDGHLDRAPLDELVSAIDVHAGVADLVVVFDEDGITGHRDHRRATEAAVAWAHAGNVPVLAWTLSVDTAHTLNDELGVGFIGRPSDQIDIELSVDRTRQLRAVECHRSQSDGNTVLWRRLDIQGNQESLCYLSQPSA